jgi:hypothetical protein
MEGREGKGGEVKERERVKHAVRDRSQSPTADSCPSATGAIAICGTPDVLLKNIQIKHLHHTFVYEMKRLQHESETLLKTCKNI